MSDRSKVQELAVPILEHAAQLYRRHGLAAFLADASRAYAQAMANPIGGRR